MCCLRFYACEDQLAVTVASAMEKDGNGNDAVRDELVKPDSEEEGGEAPVVEYYFGVGKLFRPKWLQVFRSPYFFSFIFCCDILFGGAVSTGELKVIPNL